MNKKLKSLLLFLIGALLGAAGYYFFTTNTQSAESTSPKTEQRESRNSEVSSKDIAELTKESVVIDYVKKNHELPEYYITKSEARKKGWQPSKNNLCDVLPGQAIGGDYFGNREKKLPVSEKYYEADVNYNCGHRNADRIVFTKDGTVYLTKDHYKTFVKQ